MASTSSRSLVGTLSENGDREATLQNVLSFIAEQTKQELKSRPCSSNDITKEFNIEGPAQIFGEMKISDSEYSIPKSDSKSSDNENYVTLKQLCEEFTHKKEETVNETIKQNITYAEEICLVTPLDVESENCSNIGEHPVDICSSVNVELSNVDYQEGVICEDDKVSTALTTSDVCDTYSDLSLNTTSESMTSSVSTPDTIVSKIPRRKTNVSRIPVSPSRINHNKENVQESNIPKSKVQHKFARPKLKKIVHVQQQSPPQHVITSERLPQSTSGVLSNIIEGPPHRAVSFHERATSKDVIDELNRMIKNGDEPQETTDKTVTDRLDQACRPTGWVHLENDIDLEDPKVRKSSVFSGFDLKCSFYLGESKYFGFNDDVSFK